MRDVSQGSAFGAVAVIDGKANFRKPPLAQPYRNPTKKPQQAGFRFTALSGALVRLHESSIGGTCRLRA